MISDVGGVTRGVSFWDVGEVARNPCHSVGHLYDPGATVDDLVTALEDQAMRHATPARQVTLAGYSGKYLQWSVPSHMAVTGDADFVACDLEGAGNRDFVSWEGRGGQGERWAQTAGQVDQLWILNVHGQRLVVDAAHSANATTAQIDEEDAIVRPLHFS